MNLSPPSVIVAGVSVLFVAFRIMSALVSFMPGASIPQVGDSPVSQLSGPSREGSCASAFASWRHTSVAACCDHLPVDRTPQRGRDMQDTTDKYEIELLGEWCARRMPRLT